MLARYDDGRPSQLRLDASVQGFDITYIQAVYYPGENQIQTVMQQGDLFSKQEQLFAVVAMGPTTLLTVDLDVEMTMPVPAADGEEDGQRRAGPPGGQPEDARRGARGRLSVTVQRPSSSSRAVSRRAPSVNWSLVSRTAVVDVAAAQGGDQLATVGHRVLAPLRVVGVDVRRQVAGRVQQEPGQLGPARGSVERAVEARTRRHHRGGVAAVDRRRPPSAASCSSSSICSSVMRSATDLASWPAIVGLQPEDVLDVATGERRDHVPAVRLELHHALAAQRPQRLAHRRDADAEFGGGLVEADERCPAAARRT